MRIIAIIPARGGSKRLPQKNIINFLGQPIIAYTIKAALDTKLFAEVVVSTENKEIAEIASKYGAHISLRDHHLATDQSRVVDVCLDFIEREERAGKPYDIICCLYPTSPLRTCDDIKSTVDLVVPGIQDFAIAVTEFNEPVHQALVVKNKNRLKPMWPDLLFSRNDEVGVLCRGNGSTYAASVRAFKKHRTFTGPGVKGHFMPRERSVDINVREDLELAEFYALKEQIEATDRKIA
jgi:N-acylneuraminate cytidylyltransferase